MQLIIGNVTTNNEIMGKNPPVSLWRRLVNAMVKLGGRWKVMSRFHDWIANIGNGLTI